jgi:hypothetical protein
MRLKSVSGGPGVWKPKADPVEVIVGMVIMTSYFFVDFLFQFTNTILLMFLFITASVVVSGGIRWWRGNRAKLTSEDIESSTREYVKQEYPEGVVQIVLDVIYWSPKGKVIPFEVFQRQTGLSMDAVESILVDLVSQGSVKGYVTEEGYEP